jgi:hypothetical protein
MTMSVPVRKDAASEHKYKASDPMSSGLPQWPTGMRAVNGRFTRGSFSGDAFISVAKGPGPIPRQRCLPGPVPAQGRDTNATTGRCRVHRART